MAKAADVSDFLNFENIKEVLMKKYTTTSKIST